jgi:3-phenylpropionate/trans-cinnamate dioxygenase ferredoxin subunit
MSRHVVARLREFPPGSRRIVEAAGRSIGVFNIRGEFFALRSSCPHQGAPLCLGIILGRTEATRPFEVTYRDDQDIIKCPWHGWEFDIRTGRSVFNPHRVRVRSYDVTVERDISPEDEDPSVETFNVTVEDGFVVLHA